MKWDLLNVCLNLIAIFYLHTNFFNALDINMFEMFQGIDPMGLSAPSYDYKNKQLFTNMERWQTILLINKNILLGIDPMVLSSPWTDYKNK